MFVSGQWKACCDRCGFEYLARQLRPEWTGLRTCSGPGTNDCWEVRHPQEFVRGKKDQQAPPWVRPEPPDRSVSPIGGGFTSGFSSGFRIGTANPVTADDL